MVIYESARIANTLVTATVQKIITEVLQQTAAHNGSSADSAGPNVNFAKETRDLLIECCVEFITMLSSEANEIAEREAKKTIACEHITKALDDLGFGEYVPELLTVADSFKSSQAVRASVHFSCGYGASALLTGTGSLEKRSRIRSSRAGCLPRSLSRHRRPCSVLQRKSSTRLNLEMADTTMRHVRCFEQDRRDGVRLGSNEIPRGSRMVEYESLDPQSVEFQYCQYCSRSLRQHRGSESESCSCVKVDRA